LYNFLVAYLYETHLHTSPASKCAISRGSDYIAGYRDMGYSGIIVTDHFFNGNCSLSRKLPWNEWVNRFCQGYEDAYNEGIKQGFDVFFGWEETFDGFDDYLVYGLDKNWLLEHPEVRNWTRGEQYHTVKEAGGCVVQAHPFRQRAYIPKIVLSPCCVDAVEVVNGGHEDVSFDALANRYAKKIGKPVTAGTDIHDASDIYYNELFGVYVNKKMNSIIDYVNIILNNEILGIRANEARLTYYGTENINMPVEIRDENDNITGRHWKEFI
jgi:hypothetical protein